MRLALLLLALAAALTWLQYAPAPTEEEVVAAVRRGRTPSTTSAETAPTQLHVRDAANPPGLADPPPPSAPLFRSARSPAELAVPRAGEAFTLVGIVTRDGQTIAFVRDNVDGRAWRLRQGERAGDWVLTAIDERCAILTRTRRRQEICL